jgi:hypothetical protein
VRRVVLAAVLLLCAQVAPAAALQEPLLIPRLSGPVQIDGVADEAAWAAIEPLRMVMHQPNFGGEPSERTDVRVAHDGQALYLAGRMYDSNPAGIRGTSLRRDDGSMTNDWIVINLDTFNDRENTIIIGVSPTGVRTDATYNDVRQAYNFDWNTYWDAQVRRTDEGWFVEVRIPFSSIRFQEDGGQVLMGMSVWRNVARKSELSTFPAIRPDWGTNSIFKASQFQPVVLEGVSSRRPLYAAPYVIAGRNFTSSLNTGATAYDRVHANVRDAGADIKVGLTSNLTADLTYNTDFAQIEADDQQVNLTRFSLFFPEKRQFFQERASIFEFSTGGNDRVFHSRRIGLNRGQPAPLHGGGRLVGRVGAWDVGLLNMQTAAHEALPSENMGVLRLQRQVLNDRSTIGGIVTSRRGAIDNMVYGADSFIHLRGNDYLRLSWAQSVTADGPEVVALADRSLGRVRLERSVLDGFQFALDVARVGAAFDPQLGYQQRTDYTRLGDRIAYGWRPTPASPLRRYSVALEAISYLRNSNGTVETSSMALQAALETKSGHSFTLRTSAEHEDVRSSFNLAPGVSVPAGSYSFRAMNASYTPGTASLLRTSASVNVGTFFDGWRVTTSVSPTWNVSRHLDIVGTYQLNRVRFADRDQELTAHVARLRTRIALTTRLSGAAFVQYNSAANAILLNARARLNPREGTDLYLVFNEGLVTDRFGFQPERPLTDSRTVMIKYIRTLDLGF